MRSNLASVHTEGKKEYHLRLFAYVYDYHELGPG